MAQPVVAVLMWVEAGIEAAACRTAGRMCGVTTREADAPGSQAVDVWCRDRVIAPASGRRAHVVEGDKQDVRAVLFRSHIPGKSLVVSHVFS